MVVCRWMVVGVISVALLPANSTAFAGHTPDESTTATPLRVPVTFERNDGQFRSPARFYTRRDGFQLFLADSGATFSFRDVDGDQSSVRMSLQGSQPPSRVSGEDQLPGISNYFRGEDPSKWHRNVPHYARVRYEEVYPGIDVIYYSNNDGEIEYDFVVEPGADPGVITLEFDGIQSKSVDGEGNLLLESEFGTLLQRQPVVWQEIGEGRNELEGRYVVGDDGRVEFEIEDFRRDVSLVIDPVLVYSTYLGGSFDDFAAGLAVDSSGNSYIVGATESVDYPSSTGAFGVARWRAG